MNDQYDSDVASRGESFAEDTIICPWCGYVDPDSTEWSPDRHGPEGDGELECGDCGKSFHCSRNVRWTYSTRRS